MGFNTTVFILNDHFGDIEKNPEGFVRDILRHMNDGTDWAFGQTTVMPTEHADTPRLYFSQYNSMVELDEHARMTLEACGRSNFATDYTRQAIRIARDKLDRLEKKLNELDAARETVRG